MWAAQHSMLPGRRTAAVAPPLSTPCRRSLLVAHAAGNKACCCVLHYHTSAPLSHSHKQQRQRLESDMPAVHRCRCRQEEEQAAAAGAAAHSQQGSRGQLSPLNQQQQQRGPCTRTVTAAASDGSSAIPRHTNISSSNSSVGGSSSAAEKLEQHHLEASYQGALLPPTCHQHHGCHLWAVCSGHCHPTKQGELVQLCGCTNVGALLLPSELDMQAAGCWAQTGATGRHMCMSVCKQGSHLGELPDTATAAQQQWHHTLWFGPTHCCALLSQTFPC